MNAMQRIQAGGKVAITLRVMSLPRWIHERCLKPSSPPTERHLRQERDGYFMRAGTTLTEVLMSLGIMTIGVVMVATVFPIATLRTLEASKQTNSTVARFNAEAAIDARPELIHNPDDGIPEFTSVFLPFVGSEIAANKYTSKLNPVFGSAFRGHNYVVDPYGYWSVDPAYLDPTLFGNVGAAVPPGLPPPWPASYNPVKRYNAGFPDVATAGFFVVQPDNWKLVNEAQAVGTGTPTGITSVTLEDSADLSAVTLSVGVVFRAVVFDIDGNHSEVRYLTDSTLLSMSPPTVGWPSPPAQPQALPTRFEGGNIGRVRVEVSDEIYTWMFSVRKRVSGPANVDVVVFFKRKFSGDAREERIYEASFRQWDLGANGVPGGPADDNGINGANDVGEIGFPNTDDTPNGIVTLRWPDTVTEQPVLRSGGYVFDTANGLWYRIRKTQNQTYPTGYVQIELVVDESIKLNNNDNDWNHNFIQDGAEPAAATFRGGAILHPNVVNVFPLEIKEP